MTQRNPVIDVCKGIGILLVVVGHLGTIWGSPIYMFHMSLFFILSGVCFSDKYLDLKVDFVRKRFMSILLPFLLFKGLAYVVVHFSPWNGAAAFIDHYHLLGTLWFLKCLFLASVIGLVIIWGLRKVGCNKRWMPALVSIVLASVLSMTIGDDNRAVFMWFTFHFLMGYAMKPYLGVLSDTNTSVLKILIFGGGITLLLLLPSVIPDVIADCTYINYLPYCVTAFLGSWMTLQVSSFLVQKHFLANTLIIIGQKTMPIMLFHFAAFMAVDLILDTKVIVVEAELFVKIAKFNMGIVLPILLDIIYMNIKGKLKTNIATT